MRNIVRIKIKNFMSIKDVEIVPGKVNQIVGSNGQGKTAFIKAFEWAFRGGGDKSLVRNGEDAAEVIVEMADETTARRRINARGGSSVEVSRDGAVYKSPQSYLNNLFETSSFNPIEILDPKKRNDAILQSITLKVTPEILATELDLDSVDHLPPLDYQKHGLEVIEQARAFYYQRRAEANKDALEKRKKYTVNAAELTDAPRIETDSATVEKSIETAYRSIADLTEEVRAITREREQADALKKKLTTYEQTLDQVIDARDKKIVEMDRHVGDLEIQHAHAIERLKANQQIELQTLKNNFNQQVAMLNERQDQGVKAIDQLRAQQPKELREIGDRETVIRNLNAEIEQRRLTLKDIEMQELRDKQRAMIDRQKDDATIAETFASTLTAKVDALAGPIKRKLMAQAEMPVEGLEYREGEFFVNGVSVDNLSTAESMVLAVSIARKLAKSTKAICIDGAEALDADTWKALRERFGDDDEFTYFFTKVGDAFTSTSPDDKTFVMANGEVRQ